MSAEPEAHPNDEPGEEPAAPFIDQRTRPRPPVESMVVRLIATAGIIGVAVAISAILGTQSVSAWIIGLVASLLSVVLAAVLWSSRTL
jgi:protein-S-isoprenylcysteine O-methyltransferase Ste14